MSYPDFGVSTLFASWYRRLGLTIWCCGTGALVLCCFESFAVAQPCPRWAGVCCCCPMTTLFVLVAGFFAGFSPFQDCDPPPHLVTSQGRDHGHPALASDSEPGLFWPLRFDRTLQMRPEPPVPSCCGLPCMLFYLRLVQLVSDPTAGAKTTDLAFPKRTLTLSCSTFGNLRLQEVRVPWSPSTDPSRGSTLPYPSVTRGR